MVMNFCEKCGTKREENAKFCMKCGCKFPDEHIIEEKKVDNAQEVIVPDATEPSEDNTEAPENANAQENTPAQVFVPLQTQMQMPLHTEPMSEPLKPMKKASYKGEIILLIVSVICFICSLCFFLVMKTTMFDSIGFVQKLKGSDVSYATDESPEASEPNVEIPELTVEMAEEIINNTICCFPYYYFEGKGMLNKNDYVIHPISVGTGYEVKCYTADGINTKEDFFNHFKQYVADDNLVKEIFDQEHFYIEQNSKIYFSPNEWMGWDYYSSEIMVLEKIDNETYLTYMGYDDPHIIKYVDGSFKLSAITLEEAIAPYADEDATVVIPKISGMTLDEAEAELRKVGLTLDRNNITYIATGYYMDSEIVLRAKEYYKKVKPGTSIGIYYVVEDPEFYRRGATNGETVPELTPEMAANILDIAAFLPMNLHFYEIGILNENEYVYGEYGRYDSANGMETEADLKNYYRQYVTETYYTYNISMSSLYTVQNGKPYFLQYDVGDGGFATNYMVIEKIDDFAYAVYDIRLMREFVLIYVDGAYKVTNMTV